MGPVMNHLREILLFLGAGGWFVSRGEGILIMQSVPIS